MPRPKKVGAPEPKRRSRNGCWPCKSRKVKCDEARPSCLNCAKQNEECDYNIRLNWDGRGKKKPQDAASVSHISFIASTRSDRITENGIGIDQITVPSLLDFAPYPRIHDSDHDQNGTNLEYTKQPTEMSMIDPALRQSIHLPFSASAFSTAFAGDHIGPDESQYSERHHSSTPATPLSAQFIDIPRPHLRQTTDEPSSCDASPSTYTIYNNKTTTLPSAESSVSTPPVYGSGGGNDTPSDFSSDRPAKRIRYDNSRHNPQMPPPSLPQSGYTNAPQDSANITYGSSTNPDPNLLTDGHKFNVRKLSVNSLLSAPPDDSLPVQLPSFFQTSDHKSQAWSPPSCDLYQDTESYGIDRGFLDLDIGKNDDASATSGLSPKSLTHDQEFGPDMLANLSQMEFGFGMESSDKALDVRYYDKPVPICIPRALEPLPAKLLENPMNLLYFHHFLNHTAGCLIPHNCSSNPFRSILPQMAVRDNDLLHLLLAYSASHRARLLRQPEPATRIAHWVKDIFPNLRHALDDPNRIISDANLATVIMLASLEIISPKAFGVAVPWQKHLELARQMVVARGGAHRMQTISRKDKVSSFLWSWFAYLDVLGSLSGGQNISTAWMLDYEIEDDAGDYQIDCILGFTSRCVRILAKVAALARECDGQRIQSDLTIQADWQPSNDIVSRAQKLEADLIESRRHQTKPCTHIQSRSEVEYQRDTLEVAATNEAFHSAGLIHIHRRILGKPSYDEDVQLAVHEILGSFNKVRKGSSAEACLLFPMFTAGCDIQDVKQRSDILERISRVEKFGMTQVHKARKLMEKVWETGKPWETLVGGEFFG